MTIHIQGSKKLRESILNDFIKYNQNSGSSLDEELLNGASLFFTRITTWMRLNYLIEGCPLDVLLDAISIFLSSSNRFVNEFVDVGGALTVVEILNMSNVLDVFVSSFE